MRVPRRGQFRVDQTAIHRHLKPPSIGRYEGDGINQMLKLSKQFSCQAHGPVCVVSDRAVDDLNSQHLPSRARTGRIAAPVACCGFSVNARQNLPRTNVRRL